MQLLAPVRGRTTPELDAVGRHPPVKGVDKGAIPIPCEVRIPLPRQQLAHREVG